MSKGPYQKTIPTAQLLLDTENPRLPETQKNQDNSIRTMVNAQGNKVFALAQHLTKTA